MSNNTETSARICSSESEDGDDIFNQTLLAVDELYHTRDHFFSQDPLERVTKLNQLTDSALHLIDSIPLENRQLSAQRATYHYLRGKIFDALPQYKKEAEDHLTKAIKLNPSLGDAWLSLGNCIWKKGELMAAKNCMTMALSKGPNKKILCQLSMLERKMAQGSVDQEKLIEESITHAREAVALDVKDGYSWYNLGNALLCSFFMTGKMEHSKLQQSLRAYQNAERDKKMESNPDLYFNRATVNRYLENYERALSGFEAAALKDPGLDATDEVQRMVQFLDKVKDLLSAQPNAKQVASLTSSLNTVQLPPSYKKATIDILQEGVNKGVAIVGKVLFSIKHENLVPQYYFFCDSNQTCYILSAYGIHLNAIKVGDQVTLLDPCYRHVNFSWKEQPYQFESLRLDCLGQVLVNGKVLSPQYAVGTSIYAQHKP